MTLTSEQASVRGERGQPIVETAGLRKTFRSRRGRKVVAVEGLDLTVTSGGIHGYLGPNGSGKTTTIRMLLGLIRPDAGTMSLFGLPVPKELPRTINRIGAVVEQPRLFPGFSGRDNLRVLAIAGGIDERRVYEVLEQVGLRERAADRVKGYSLGMKQRLALAATLLRDPDLLILDEPTNGLDPAGIREIRELMRSLADQGVTILVSSHILSELQQVVDHVTIINRGRLLASGPVDQILGATRGGVRLTVAEPDRAAAVLTGQGLVVVRDHESMLVTGAPEPAAHHPAAGRAGPLRLLAPSERTTSRAPSWRSPARTARQRNTPRPTSRLPQPPAGRQHDQPRSGRTPPTPQATCGVVPGGVDGRADRGRAGQLLVRHPPGDRVAEGRLPANYGQAVKDWDENGEKYLEDCKEGEAEERKTDPSVDYQCDTMGPPEAGGLRLHLRTSYEQMPLLLLGFGAIAAGFLVLVSATYVGADHAAGTISTQLLFAPTRWKVWVAKASAIASAGVAAAIVSVGFGGLARGWR